MYNCIIKATQLLICQNKSSIKGFRLLLVHFHARNYFTFQLTKTLRVRVQHYQKKGHLRTKNSVFYLETPTAHSCGKYNQHLVVMSRYFDNIERLSEKREV